jgi:HEAT repeat protein
MSSGSSKFEKITRQLFSHPNWNVRAVAAMDLGKMGKIQEFRKAAVEALSRALINDIEFNVRSYAAESLGRIGDAGAVVYLAKAMEDSEFLVRSTATQALGKIGKPAVEALIEGLKSKDESVRMYAAMALGRIKDVRAVAPLIEALRIKTRLGGAEGSASTALTEIGEPAVEPLITVLKDNDDNVRVLAIISLGGIGDARAVEPLISTLKDDNKRVRNFAAKALKKIGGEKAEQYLKDYKKQNPWYKRL